MADVSAVTIMDTHAGMLPLSLAVRDSSTVYNEQISRHLAIAVPRNSCLFNPGMILCMNAQRIKGMMVAKAHGRSAKQPNCGDQVMKPLILLLGLAC